MVLLVNWLCSYSGFNVLLLFLLTFYSALHIHYPLVTDGLKGGTCWNLRTISLRCSNIPYVPPLLKISAMISQVFNMLYAIVLQWKPPDFFRYSGLLIALSRASGPLTLHSFFSEKIFWKKIKNCWMSKAAGRKSKFAVDKNNLPAMALGANICLLVPNHTSLPC